MGRRADHHHTRRGANLTSYDCESAAMSDRNNRLHVSCPCCEAKLTVDRETGAVLAHEAVDEPIAGGADFDDLLADLDRQKQRAEQRFEQEQAAMADRDRVLDERFAEAFRRAEEDPDDAPPPRPFDLD